MSSERHSQENIFGFKPSRYGPNAKGMKKSSIIPLDDSDGVILMGIRRASSCGQLLDGSDNSRPKSFTDDSRDNRFSSFPDGIGPPPRLIKISIGDEHAPVNGLSSRRHIGKSLDKLLCKELSSEESDKCYRLEKGLSRMDSDVFGSQSSVYMPTHALLENPEFETRWYFKFFLGKYHQNYLGYDLEKKNPFFLSVVPLDKHYRCILWQKTGSQRLSVKPASNGKMPSLKGILEKFGVPRSGTSLRELSTPDVQKDFITLEEQEGAVHFKFGVLYAREGQQTDDEMFSNEHGSKDFEDFLGLLGERVALKNFPNYRGGLDNKNNSTGTHSVYTTFEGHEIMFHVSTLLPYHPENKQQVERKRHIGNDIVVIIFMDGDTHRDALQAALTFDPSISIKSHFNHIFAVVTYNRMDGTYRLCMYSDSTMPDYSPPLPIDGLFHDPNTFRDFLLAKLINGEKASYSLPVFAEKRERTLDLLIKGIEQRYKPVQRRASSGSTAIVAGKKAYEAAFTEIGQKLKVERYLKGTHPTSQRSTQTTKNSPWEPLLLVEDFSHPITCGDSYDENIMVVATPSDGTVLLYRDGQFSLLIDKSVPVVQLVVAHKHDLIIFRTGFNKDNFICIVPLPYFNGRHGANILDKSKLSSFRVSASKGSHLFCTTPLEEKYLRVFVAVKNKIFMWMWKYTSESMPKNLENLKISDNLTKHREVTLSDTPLLMSMKEEFPSGKLFVSYKSGLVEVVDEISAEVKKFASLDPKHRINSLSLTSDSKEVLIGYNFSCRFCATEEEETQSKTVDCNFYSEPQTLVHINAYILAFNSDSLEVRLASNGSLVQSMSSQHIQILSHKRDILFVTGQRLLVSSEQRQSVDLKFFASKLSSAGVRRSTSGSTATPEEASLHYIYRISYDKLVGPKSALDLIPRTISVSSNQTDEADGLSVDSSDSTLLEIPRDSRSPSYSPDPPRRHALCNDQPRHTSPGRIRPCMKKTVFFSTSSNSDGDIGDLEDDFFPTQIPIHSRGLLRTMFSQHDSSPDSGFVSEEYKNTVASNLEVLPMDSRSTLKPRTSTLQVLPIDSKSN